MNGLHNRKSNILYNFQNKIKDEGGKIEKDRYPCLILLKATLTHSRCTTTQIIFVIMFVIMSIIVLLP